MSAPLPEEQYEPVFTTLGIPWTASYESWRYISPKFFIGVMFALVVSPEPLLLSKIVIGLGYGVLLNLVLILHTIGHIITSKLVLPAMSEIRITPEILQTRFDSDPESVAPMVHITRSIGGPLMNFFIGFVCIPFAPIIAHHFFTFFIGANFLLAFLLLLPFPYVDGEVIWREIARMRREGKTL